MHDDPLRRLLEAIESKATGELVCDAGGVEVHAYLQAGRIVWATDSQHPRAFAQYLKQHAHLDDDGLEAAFAEGRQSHIPLGETLVAWKLATLDQVRNALRHQIGPALALLAESSSAKVVFLARVHSSRYDPGLTFDAREFPSAVRATAPGLGANAGRPDLPRGPGPEQRGTSTPPSSRTENPRPTVTKDPPPVVKPAAAPARAQARGSSFRRGLAVLAGVGLLVAGFVITSVARRERPSAPASETTLASEALPSSASGASTLIFGMAAPFSGATEELGHDMRTGVQTAFAVANEEGGVNGRKLQLVALDDGYDPARTLKVMQDLVENRKVFGIVGNFGTPTAAVSLPYVMEKKVLFFGALTGAPLLRKSPPDRYVFNYRPSYAEETAAALRYLLDVRRIRASQIAVFSQDDQFGQAGLSGVEEQLRRMSYDPSQMVRTTYGRGSAEVSGAVARIWKERSRIRAVVMIATYGAAAALIRQLKDLGGNFVFTNVSAVDSNALAEVLLAAGTGYTTDVVVTQIAPLPTSKATAAIEYRAALDKYTAGEKPSFVTFEGYIVGKLLVEGLRRAGKNLNTESLVDTLEGIRGLDMGIGAPISFGPSDHQGSHKVWGTMLQPDGIYRSIKLE